MVRCQKMMHVLLLVGLLAVIECLSAKKNSVLESCGLCGKSLVIDLRLAFENAELLWSFQIGINTRIASFLDINTTELCAVLIT